MVIIISVVDASLRTQACIVAQEIWYHQEKTWINETMITKDLENIV